MQRRRRQEHYRREPSIDIKCLFNSVSGLVRESQWFHRPRRGGSCVWTVTVELVIHLVCARKTLTFEAIHFSSLHSAIIPSPAGPE